jgi:sulfite exporter TauE/SafE
MISLALAVLGASLIGSLHCAAMCGGLVGVYAADPAPRGRWRRGSEHVAYNGGRLVAYAGLGAGAGALGASVDLAAALAGLGRVAAVAAGVLIVLWGVISLLEASGLRAAGPSALRWLRTPVTRALARVGRRDLVVRAGAIGLATGIMPCGWLYAFVAAAAGTASPLAGAGLMLAFWAGTVPAMLGVGVGLRTLAWPIRRYVPTLGAAAMIVIGLMTVAARVAPGTIGHPLESLVGAVQAVGQSPASGEGPRDAR